jgi:hypothetical protein
MTTIDYNRYDYTKFGSYKNVMTRWDKGQTQRPVRITSFLSPLIDKLALYHGHWTIIGEATGWSDYIHSFLVYEDNEYVGRFTESHRREDGTVDINSRSIEQSLRRGRYMTTSDLKKAYKIIKGNFVAEGFTSRAHNALSKSRSAVAAAAYKTSRDATAIYDRLRHPLLCYLYHNIANVGPALEAFGADPFLVASLRTAYEEMKVGEQGHAAAINDTGVAVTPFKDRFLVCAPNQEPVLMTQTELPETLRTKMAMLKLLDQDNVILEDVGIRTDGNIFYIMP